MADQFFLNFSRYDKGAFKECAARNECSRQVEAKAIPKQGFCGERRDWVSLLREAALFEEGEFVEPMRHAIREAGVKG